MSIGIVDVLVTGGALWTATSVFAYTRWALPALSRVEWPKDLTPGVRPGIYVGLYISSYLHVFEIIRLATTTDNEEVIEEIVAQVKETIKESE